ncbi:MAG: flagellar hook-associated protein 3 [Spirochaeta sp. LUC14_002_19_P3]|nr:MAG: flagellar hook-associated protein 3 [Spirochaeta sp. LUC14_002_19_P3]
MRVSSNMPFIDNRFRMESLEYRTNHLQNGISSSRAMEDLRDAPIDAGHAVRLDSFGKRLDRYQKNIEYTNGRMAQAEGYINEAVTLMQRLRELSLQGAHGTYTQEETSIMALEVNQLLDEFTSVINAKGGDGHYLFAGDDSSMPPFLIQKGRVPNLGPESITAVKYTGGISRSKLEIMDGRSIDLNLQGNKVFWAESQKIFGARDTEGFIVRETNRFFLDGKEIILETGDNIHTLVRKINEAGAAVKASLDPVTGSLNMETTLPHQVWLEPVEGTALVDLGVLREAGNTSPPMNWHPDAMVSGGGIFDQIIALRDALLAGNQEKIGGVLLGGLDEGLDNLLRNLGDIGAVSNRLSMASSRLDEEGEAVGNWKSLLADLDMTEAITNMKMLEYTQEASYRIAGRLFQLTLMDYLK